ncbi:hypothetical protein [Acanthamoeba castellanii mimivirus]|uniref:Uncharacterized protein R342 n=6 Tax=Mimivirus TaxID=315393 RepID=YR342_MIMIV|nr:hypothetical protein MIMI_gp0370 [Acanthamoeba polyphaga mimivirus]Q5UQT8.1 RecName: Full=Uncharacterized protein R342 [Acanthamoeba polyphaga mimivirus]AHA45523.1 hypothetical protein HIRU_S617 [Hirudovirus strain Sangsue]ALR83922.1 hypothetical protein [Niemeyer virus]QTF49254.1 hypothetical protein [Mimivirus reunion]WMV61697.1 hypothetical protein qu_362 [Mimivirus sp.]BAV61442.1 hypothetical protein [Acanthamoeba castellanii mimivirus]
MQIMDYQFPYCSYPYNFSDKIKFCIGKIVCKTFDVIGIKIYSKITGIYLEPEKISSYNLSDTNHQISNEKNLIYSNIKWLIVGITIIPTIYYGTKLQYIPESKLWYIGTPLVFMNLFNTLSHICQYIQLKLHTDKLKHNIEITNSLENPICILDSIDYDSIISTRKLIWSTTKVNHNYVVYNAFYSDLFFVFDREKMLNDFILEKLSKLSENDIDCLANDPSRNRLVQQMQDEFIRNKLYLLLMQCYRHQYTNSS